MNDFLKTTVKLCMIVILVGIGVCLTAQDIILKTDGSEINAKVLEITDRQVKYKDFDFQSGPTRNLDIFDVFMITYENGKKEVFSAKTHGEKSQQPAQPQSQAYLQQPDGGFSIHFGGSFPIGDFGGDPDYYLFILGDGVSSAGPGFNIGIKGKISLPVNGLGITLSGDFIFNGLKGTGKEYFDDMEAHGYDVKRPRFINVPLFVGLNYKYSVNSKFGIWAEGAIGANFKQVTVIEASHTGYYGKYYEKYDFDTKTSFAGQIGGGIMLSDLFSIGVHYYGLGKTKATGRYTSGEAGYDSHSTTFTSMRKYAQDCVMLRLGFHF